MGNAVCCLRIAVGLVIASSLAACTGSSSDNTAAASAAQYTVGGTVTGLTGSGLTLQNNSGETLAVTADGPFTFRTTLTSGSAYYVIAGTQPGNPIQTCAVGHSTGTIGGANVADVSVVCTNKTDTTADAIGITVVGVRGSGLVIQNNGGDNLTPASDGTLTFPAGISPGSPYEISVLSPPIEPYEDCVVVNGSGTTTGSDVGNIVVSCTVNTNPKHSISGTIVGVSGSIVLQDNGRDDLTVTADGPFVFPLQIPQGSVYDVSTKSAAGVQSQACQFQNARGVVGAQDVTNIVLTCNANISLKVATTGLSGTGLVLQNNGRDNLPVSANGTSSFPTGLIAGDAYSVTVATQPTNPSQTCVVTNGTGTAAQGVTATLTCTTNQFGVGGTVTGLPDPTQGANINLVLQNNLGDDFTIPVNSQSPVAFQFPIKIASGTGYSVTVKTQPGVDTQFAPPGVTQTSTVCLVSAGTGIVANGDVTSVVVNCVRPSGFAYVTNGTDNTVTPYVVDSATALLLPSGPAIATGAAPSSSATLDNTASLYVSNTGSGYVSVYDMDYNTGVLKLSAGSPIVAGLTAPTSVALQFPVNGPTLYATNSAASGSVSALRIGATPATVSVVNTVAAGAGPTSGYFYVGSAPTFHTYYAVSNSAADSLSLYRIDDTTGALTAVQNGFPTGKTPRSIGHYSGVNPASGLPFETLYVANTADGTISTLSFNTAAETLAQQGAPQTVGTGLNSLVQTGTGVYATAAQGVYVYSYLADGSLFPAQANPFAAGNGPGAAAGFQGYLYVVNQVDETVSVFFLATGGTAVAVTPNVPIKTGHGPTSIVVVQRPQFGGG